jgi:hypothetical protein
VVKDDASIRKLLLEKLREADYHTFQADSELT